MKVLGFAGSLRSDSYNKKSLTVALQGAKGAGAETEAVDLRGFDILAYDWDMEQKSGLPNDVKRLKEKIAAADALLIATPEYNNSFSGVLKNTLDWVSRPPGEAKVTNGKPTGLITASDGRFGGVRAAIAFRAVARSCGMVLLNKEVQVAKASEVFDGGKIVDERVEKQLKDLGKEVVEWAKKLEK